MTQDPIMQLRARMRGEVLWPSEPGYEEARRIWNGTIDKHPRVIARCESAADVIEAVRFAGERGLGVSVRGGGHHVAGSSILHDGLVVDLSRMRGVEVDARKGRVRCQGGARIGDLDRATQPHGLAVPLGVVSETGIAGLTLAGGMGWMRRKHGLSCDNLLAADVVLHDGSTVHAGDDQHEELLWALRGGGWDLGVVVAFEFQAHPVGPDVFMTFVTYPRAEGRDVLRGFRDAYRAAPSGVAPLAVCWSFPDGDEAYPRALWGQPFIGVVGPYIGAPDEGERVTRPLRSLGTVLFDRSETQSWITAQRFFDADYPAGGRYYWKSSYLEDLSDDCIDTLLELADLRPSPQTSIDIWALGDAIADTGLERSPIGHRHAPFGIGVECNWKDPAHDAVNRVYGREAIARLEPFSTGGSYLNFEDPDDPKATAAAYGTALERLRRVKHAYDPDNLFRSRRGLTGG
jgi:FAD/FMN-containing dehydrogenase